MIYSHRLAEKFKNIAGQKYCPANGTEGQLFQEAYCQNCAHDNFDGEDGESCEILLDTLIMDVKDEEYPNQWIIGTDGQPTCTAFERKIDREQSEIV